MLPIESIIKDYVVIKKRLIFQFFSTLIIWVSHENKYFLKENF